MIDDELFRRVLLKKILLLQLQKDKGQGDEGIDGEGPLLPVHGSQVGVEYVIAQGRGHKLTQPVTRDLVLRLSLSPYLMELAYGDLSERKDQIAPIGGDRRMKVHLIEMHLLAPLLPAELIEGTTDPRDLCPGTPARKRRALILDLSQKVPGDDHPLYLIA